MRAPAARSRRSVWSRVGTGSITVVGPGRGVEAREQDARLDLGRGDRQLVADRLQLAAAVDVQRRPPVAVAEHGAHQAQRHRHAVDRAPPDRLVAVERERAALADEQPGQQAHQRARVVARRSGPPARAGRAARSRGRAGASRPRRGARRGPSDSTAASVASVSALAPKPLTSVAPSQTAPISSERCEIDLSPGTAISPTSAAAGATSRRSDPGRRAHVPSASTGAASAP